MWYFAWILGLPLAAIFAVMNAMWLELKEDEKLLNRDGPTPARPARGCSPVQRPAGRRSLRPAGTPSGTDHHHDTCKP